MQTLIKTSSEKVFSIFTYVLAFVFFIVGFWALDRGVAAADEGYFLCVLREQPMMGMASQYHLLFGNIFNNDILATRILMYLIRIGGYIVLAWGLYKYFARQRNIKFLFVLSVVIITARLGLIAFPTICYLNLTVSNICYICGILMIGNFRNKVALFLSGFLVGLQLPIMITSLGFSIPLFLISIYILSGEKRLINCLFFISGILGCWIFFFLWVIPLQAYITNFKSLFDKTIDNGEKQYGFVFLIIWFARAIISLGLFCLIGYIIFCFQKLLEKKELNKPIISISIVIVIISIVYGLSKVKPSFFFPIQSLLWIIAFYSIWSNKRALRKNEIIVICLLFLLPIGCALGTNISFVYKTLNYTALFVPIVFILIFNNRVLLLFIECIFAYYLLISIIRPITPYDDFITFSNQTRSVKDLGISQSIKVDDNRYDDLRKLKRYVHPNDYVVCDRGKWYAGALLETRSLHFNYRCNLSKLIKNIQVIKPQFFYCILSSHGELNINDLSTQLNKCGYSFSILYSDTLNNTILAKCVNL